VTQQTDRDIQHETVHAATLKKVTWRLIPFMMVLYFVAFLDRVNVGFAALQMNADLGFSATVYGAGAGIFFLGYVLFEVPSNIALQKYGARIWIARIMLSWGLISGGMAFVQGPNSFYAMRFLLGVAEAGFFPGMILYLTFWYPVKHRAYVIGAFMMAIPISNFIGAPLSSMLMTIEGLGLKGWQWLFILEALPAVLLSGVVLVYLTDKPEKADWLTEAEKNSLIRALEEDAAQRSATSRHSLKDAFLSPKIWMFSLIYFGIGTALYGLGFFLPQIVRGFGDLTLIETGLLTAVPYAVATVVMFFWGRHSDATEERVWHVALPALVGASAFVALSFGLPPAFALAALVVGACGIFGCYPAFWCLPTAMLGGTAAAGGIALVNSIGNTSGYFGPQLIGFFRDADQDYSSGYLVMAAGLGMTCVLTLLGNRKGAGKTH
jgi:ACS family tartrate transporter-like MFS transporter